MRRATSLLSSICAKPRTRAVCSSDPALRHCSVMMIDNCAHMVPALMCIPSSAGQEVLHRLTARAIAFGFDLHDARLRFHVPSLPHQLTSRLHRVGYGYDEAEEGAEARAHVRGD